MKPRFLVMAGPNGAGKSTCVGLYLPAGMPFINADEIARTLGPVQAPETDVQAARIALERMDELAGRRESFATESTLASRTLASRASRLRKSGCFFQLVYVWSPSPEFSIGRVAGRVRLGGHDIPEETIRRRWLAGLKNFFALYRPIADHWEVVDNTKRDDHVGSRPVYGSTRSRFSTRLSGIEFGGGRTVNPDQATIQENPTLDGDEMMRLMALGVAEALRKHRAAGVPIVVWDDATQQPVEIPADQIPDWIDRPDAFPPN